jgi:hypothetical protein
MDAPVYPQWMLGRRFLLLVAVLMGLTALAASIAPREPINRDGRGTATPTATPTRSTSGGSDVQTLSKRVNTAEGVTRVVVDEGDLVDLEVSGSEVDSVTLMDEVSPIDPDSPAVFQLLADTPGEYPIELLDADRQVGTLHVRARD